MASRWARWAVKEHERLSDPYRRRMLREEERAADQAVNERQRAHEMRLAQAGFGHEREMQERELGLKYAPGSPEMRRAKAYQVSALSGFDQDAAFTPKQVADIQKGAFEFANEQIEGMRERLPTGEVRPGAGVILGYDKESGEPLYADPEQIPQLRQKYMEQYMQNVAPGMMGGGGTQGRGASSGYSIGPGAGGFQDIFESVYGERLAGPKKRDVQAMQGGSPASYPQGGDVRTGQTPGSAYARTVGGREFRFQNQPGTPGTMRTKEPGGTMREIRASGEGGALTRTGNFRRLPGRAMPPLGRSTKDMQAKKRREEQIRRSQKMNELFPGARY